MPFDPFLFKDGHVRRDISSGAARQRDLSVEMQWFPRPAESSAASDIRNRGLSAAAHSHKVCETLRSVLRKAERCTLAVVPYFSFSR